MRVLGGVARLGEFFARQQPLQFLHARVPALLGLARLLVAERIGKAAPAHVAREQRLLRRRGATIFGLDGLERADGGEVVLELGDLATLPELKLIRDLEVGPRNRGVVQASAESRIDSTSRISC